MQIKKDAFVCLRDKFMNYFVTIYVYCITNFIILQQLQKECNIS